jgi:hypothetical protein
VKTRKTVFFDHFGDIEDAHAWFGNDGWAYSKARKRFAGGSCEKCPFHQNLTGRTGQAHDRNHLERTEVCKWFINRLLDAIAVLDTWNDCDRMVGGQFSHWLQRGRCMENAGRCVENLVQRT